jgi:hypothetical protein
LSGAFAYPLVRFNIFTPMPSYVRKYTLLNVLAAFGFGYFVFRRWKPVSAKWVWSAGLCLFIAGCVIYWHEQGAARLFHLDHSVYWGMSGIGCSYNAEGCLDFFAYTIPLLRTISYSAGAFACSRVGEYGWSGWSRLKHWPDSPPDA